MLLTSILPVDIAGASEANFAPIFKFSRCRNPLSVDERPIATTQILDDMTAIAGIDLGMSFGNGWMLDDEVVVQCAPDQNFTAIENAGERFFSGCGDRNQMGTTIQIFRRR